MKYIIIALRLPTNLLPVKLNWKEIAMLKNNFYQTNNRKAPKLILGKKLKTV